MPRQATPAAAAATAKSGTLQCFKPGSHLALQGQTIQFSMADVQATAAAYNPKLHEAPLVVGHPELDAPAYGWVAALEVRDGALEATPHQVNPEFAELVNQGAYKKMSAAFWSPNAPGNPVPGVFYLRHVGFLGAAAPAVPGLRTPSFAGGEEGVVEFAAWDDVDNASLWRALRDWLLGKFGAADADSAVPPYLVASVERAAQAELEAERQADLQTETAAPAAPPMPAFGQPRQPTEHTVTPEQKAALEAENARLRQQLEEQQRASRQARLDAVHTDAVAFADGLVASGRLPQAQTDVVVSTIDAVARLAETEGAVVQFSQGEARAPLLPALRELLSRLPAMVEPGQVATAGRAAAAGAPGASVSFAAPPGTVVDPERLALHERTLAYMRAHPGTAYTAAVKAVS